MLPVQMIFFILIALKAGDDNIFSGGHASSHNGNFMIHGQLSRNKCLLTVITAASANLLAPPLTLA
jgi:hypothetical protein